MANRSERLIDATVKSCIILVLSHQTTLTEFIADLANLGWDDDELVRIEVAVTETLRESAALREKRVDGGSQGVKPASRLY